VLVTDPIVKALIVSSSKKHPLDDMELAALGRLLNEMFPGPVTERATRRVVEAAIAHAKRHPLDDEALAALGWLLNTLDDTPYPAPSGEPGTLTNFPLP
jgi:hypothetical protein